VTSKALGLGLWVNALGAWLIFGERPSQFKYARRKIAPIDAVDTS